MERQRKREQRVSGGAEKDGCIFSLCLSSAVTQGLALPLTRGQTISGLAVNIKGNGFLCPPWSEGDTDPCNTKATLSQAIATELTFGVNKSSTPTGGTFHLLTSERAECMLGS